MAVRKLQFEQKTEDEKVFGMEFSTGCRERRRSMDDGSIVLSALREGAVVLDTGREKNERSHLRFSPHVLVHNFTSFLRWHHRHPLPWSKPGAMTPLPQLEAIATSASSSSNKGKELGPSAESFRAPAYQIPVREEPKVCLFAV